MELNFRVLRADEIDCRVARINNDGLLLLLYKDARCDMNMLDETVGPMNWTRRHSRDNANCTVSIYDSERDIWVGKEDVGTESNTEAAKGLASDSFKRACYNWGIGRELYTAPVIWIEAGNYRAEPAKNGRLACKDSFSVAHIDYDFGRTIIELVIRNNNSGRVVYQYGIGRGKKPTAAETAKPAETTKPEDKAPKEAQEPQQEDRPRWVCAACGGEIQDVPMRDRVMPAAEIAQKSTQKYGKPVCMACAYKTNGNQS